MTRKYDPQASQEVKKTMDEYKYKHEFKNREQAIAVGIEMARKKGLKVPKRPKERTDKKESRLRP